VRKLSNALIVSMIGLGIYQLWPLISVTFFSDSQKLDANILVCELMPDGDDYRLHIIYEYCVDVPVSNQREEIHCVLASQMSDISGKRCDNLLFSAEDAALFQPMIEDSDLISGFLPRPIVFVDPDSPLSTGRLYLAFEQGEYRHAVLCIALPLIIWLCSLLIRSFLIFQREPEPDSDV
jgi:hypothetical protein